MERCGEVSRPRPLIAVAYSPSRRPGLPTGPQCTPLSG